MRSPSSPLTVTATLLVAGAALFALSALAGPASLTDLALRDAVLELRLTRSLVAYLVGAALAVGGVVTQGLFRNPLASPDVLGTTAAASFVGKLSLLGFEWLLRQELLARFDPELLLPIGCMLGAVCALALLLALARAQRDPIIVLLCGFLLSALFLSLGSLVTSLAQESWEVGRAVISFALGTVSGAGLRQVGMLAPLVLVGSVAAWHWAHPLDLLLSGEEEAHALGLDVMRARRYCIAWAALLTAGAVAVGGNIGFVGLVVPHGLRRLVGVSHRALVPAAFAGGGAFVLFCDLTVRAIPSRSEVPLGVLTSMLGAPLFLWLLLRGRRGGAL